MSQRNFRTVDTNFVKLEDVGSSVEGTLIEKSSMTFPGGGVVGRYKLEQDDGTIQTVMGSTALDDLLEAVPEGVYLRVTYTGDQKTRAGRKVKQYRLEIADE